MSFIEGISAISSGAAGLVPTGGGLTGSGSMAVGGLGGLGGLSGTDATPGVDASATGFGNVLTKSIESLDNVQSSADNLAVQAATGDLKDVHDYTLAASRAQLMTELVVAVRNKGIDAFTEIMRMPL